MNRGSKSNLSTRQYLRRRPLLVLIILLSIISAGTCSSIRPLRVPLPSIERKQPARGGAADARRRRLGAGRRHRLHLATVASPFLARPNDDVAVALPAEQQDGEGSSGSSHVVQTITSKAISLLISFYGIALLLHGLPTFSAQVHVLTMMRARGAK